MIPQQFHNLPVHPLAVHATVILIPLALLMVVLFVIPRTRAWAALPMAVVAVAALVSTWVSRESGFNMKSYVVGNFPSVAEFEKSDWGKAVIHHQSLANVLSYLMIPFAIVAVVVYLMWRRPSWWPVRADFTGAVQYVACGVLLVLAVIVAVQVSRVGEAGSKAVYNPAGTIDFSSSPPLSALP